MTNAIKSFSNKYKVEIGGRRANPRAYVRSVNINQCDGNFVVARPLANDIVVYGQNPNKSNSWFINNQYISNLYDYGEFNFPSDAKFDFVRRKIWVADTGNNRVLQIDYNTFLVDFEITNLVFPCALAIDANNGDLFVRGFTDESTGVIYWLNQSGQSQDIVTFSDNFINDEFELNNIVQDGYDLPSPYAMDFDHVRKRLWWTSDNKSFMMDMHTMIISSYNFDDLNLKAISPVEVEYSTGNVFVGCFSDKDKVPLSERFSTIVYMFKDNDYPIEIMSVADSVKNDSLEPETQPGIVSGQTTPWPSVLNFDGFDNPSMNGDWELSGNYRGQIYSYVNPNGTLKLNEPNPIGQYGIGTYVLQPYGVYEWQFIFYKIDEYPIISQKWIYQKETKNNLPTGNYVLVSYYSYDKETQNEYLNDNGMVSIG